MSERAAGEAPVDGTRHGRRYERDAPGLEFDRVVNFSDAVFAIAMTLLVVGIAVPDVRAADLGDALGDLLPEITSFFISFVIIGNYWLAHHRFFSYLTAVDGPLMLLNLVYLAAIAFAPFPTALAGRYEQEPITIVMFALTLAVASGIEAVIFLHAHRAGLFRRSLPTGVVRYSVIASLVPPVLFVGSIPLAFVSTSLALLSWILVFPLELLVGRTVKPPEADALLR